MEGNGEQVRGVLDLLKGQRDPAVVQQLVEQAIQHRHRDDNPKFWADLHAMLGAALTESAHGRWTPELLARVLAAYRSALTVYSPDQWPGLWTQTQLDVGATYLRAVSSGIGETRQYIEQAIAAYETALRIPYTSLDSETWLRCLLEMAKALSVAAEWRGTSALIASAGAYEAALSVVTRETSPEQWAQLNLKIARNLERVGTDECIERGIRAADNALLVLRAETDLRDWSEAHLLLGGFYRPRRRGNREENLERAIDSLDKALSVFTRDTALDPWYRAHYHRGPAWLFRKRGDHDNNLIHAMESLQIAIDLTDRDRAPEVWASLQVALGQAFLERRSGDPVANVESAITALEGGYAVLPPDTGVLSWKLASRMLGEAYLERRGGDFGDNVARAIAVLTALQEKLPEPDDPPAWTGSLVNLARAWKDNRQGDPQSNRAKAIECFENALRVPADSWGSRDEWSAAARTLCFLYLGEKAEKFGKPRAFDRAATHRESSWVEAKTDPLDLAGQAQEQVEALRQARDAGLKPDLQNGWHVPSLLNDEGQLLRQNLNQFLKAGKVNPA